MKIHDIQLDRKDLVMAHSFVLPEATMKHDPGIGDIVLLRQHKSTTQFLYCRITAIRKNIIIVNYSFTIGEVHQINAVLNQYFKEAIHE